MKYRKRPLVIDAVQMREGNTNAILEFMRIHACPFEVTGAYETVIHTPEGDMHASPGDWIIKGVAGEFYPCKPDIFDATYEPVEGTDAMSSDAPADLPRPFEDLGPAGLLWLINTTVFHPRGYALALHTNDEGTEYIGWSLLGDGSEPWTMARPEETPAGSRTIDDAFDAVKELMP